METVVKCPLGMECEEAKDNKLIRCGWYTQIAGKNPQTGADIDEWRCAMSWLPILMLENAQTNRGQTAALESFRNETVRGQAEFTKALSLKE